MSDALRLVGYPRVSTEEQAREGVSLDAQEKRIRSYCEIEGFDLVDVCRDEGASADSLRRPGLIRAVNMMSVGHVDGLVVAKLDRLTRRMRDWITLEDLYFSPGAGKRLFSATGPIDTATAAGRFAVRIQVLISEWELDTIHERTNEAVEHLRSKGERIGHVPYGSMLAADGRTLAPDPEEVRWIEHMRSLRTNDFSLQEICDWLNANGIPTKRGSKWYPSTVTKILDRSRIDVRV